MSNLTRAEARDEMLGVVNTALTGYDASFVVLWDDDDSKRRPKDREAHAVVGVYHINGTQTAFGTTGASRERKFTRYGYIEVLVKTPEGDGLTLADELATIVHDALEGATTTGGVIFRNVRATEEGKSGSFSVTNVTADFEYDQLR